MKPAADLPEGESPVIGLNRLAAIVESSDDAIISKDLSGIVTSWNCGAQAIFGYPADEMIGASILKIIPPDRQEEETFILNQIRQGEKIDHFETVRRTKDGLLIHVSVTASPLRDAEGRIVGVSKIARDITRQKAHEQEITRLSRLYAALSQINQAIVWKRNRTELFDKICQVLVEFGNFSLAWIGLADAGTREVRPAARWGEQAKGLADAVIQADNQIGGHGPMGAAISGGRSFVINDFARETSTNAWRDLAQQAGFRAAAAFPIRLGHAVCGAIMVASVEAGFFRDMEIALLEEAAGDVSFALDFLAQETNRLVTEGALRESERFNRAIVDALATHLAVLDEHGVILATNDAWRRFAGQNNTNWRLVSEGVNYSQACAASAAAGDADAARTLQAIEAVTAGRQSEWVHEYPCHGPHEQRWFSCRITRFPGDGLVRVVVAHENITERKLAELARSESEERYLALFERSRDCVFLHDFNGRFLDANQAALDLLGYQKADLGRLTLAAVLTPDQLERALRVISEIQATGHQQQPSEFRLQARDGRLVHVETQSSLLYREGRPIAIQGIARDLTERRRAGEALAASEKKFRELVQNMDIGLMIHGPDLKILFANDMAIRLLDLPAEALHAKATPDPAWQFLREDGTPMTPEEYPVQRALAAPDGIMAGVIAGLRRPGREQPVWLQCNGHVIRHPDGTVRQTEVTFTDLTDRKEGEEKLRRANRALQMLSRCNEALIRATDEPELLESICRIAVEIGGYLMAWVGYARQDAARTIEPVAQYGDHTGYLAEIRLTWNEQEPTGRTPAGRVIRGGAMVICEDVRTDPDFIWREQAIRRQFRSTISLPLRDGPRTFGVLNLATPGRLQSDAEEFKLLQELADDLAFGILHQQAGQERLRSEAAQARLATAVEQAAESILITALDGTLVYVNPAFEKISGYTRGEVLGRDPRFLHPHQAGEEWHARMWSVLQQGETWQGRLNSVSKDGRAYEEEVTISPVRNATGEVINYVSVHRDVTREVKLEAQFRQAQKMEAFGQLAGGVAHDFNNILAVIQLQAGLLKSEPSLTPEQLEFAADIEKAAVRGANLTRQLLLFSRRQTLQLQNLDLGHVLENITRMLERTLGEQVRLRLKLAGPPLIVHADPGMLDQILLNLVVNARDAMPDGGQIIIETSPVEFDELTAAQAPKGRAGLFACLSVSDTGCGIPPEILPRIFEPFFTTKEVGKGTGLGLATVFGIVQQHKGWINVYSTPGQGSTFRVYLPRLVAESDTARFHASPPSLRGGHETILLVEDEAPLRDTVRLALTRLGYEVLTATSGADALKVWQSHSHRIQLLLTDMLMPGGLTGRDLARTLRLQNPALRVIYSSGYSPEIASAGLRLVEGVNFLAKPFEARKLASAVRLSLDAAAPAP